MLSRTLSAAVLLACSAAILPAYAEKANDESARTAGAQTVITAAEHTNAHSAVSQSPLMPAPAFTTVITAEEMQDNHYETVAEALAYAPGLTVTPGSVNTNHQVVRIDGDDRVAVFIDGRKQNLASGHSDGRATYDLDMAPPVMAIERIEILHGPAGDSFINYDTPGGVINIITKKGKEHEFKFEGARGPYDAWRWETQLTGSGKGWSWVGTGGRSNLEKLRYKSVDGDKETMPNSAVSRREMYFRIDRQFNKNSSLNFTYGHFSNDRGLWYSRLNPTDYNYSKMANHLALTYNYKENSATPGYVSVYHYYNQGDTFRPTGVKNQEDLLSYGRWKTTTNGIDWRDSWLLGKKPGGTAGCWAKSATEALPPDSPGATPAQTAIRIMMYPAIRREAKQTAVSARIIKRARQTSLLLSEGPAR